MTPDHFNFVDVSTAILRQENSPFPLSMEDLLTLVDLKLMPAYQAHGSDSVQVRPIDIKRFGARVRRGMKAEGLFPDPEVFRIAQPQRDLGKRIFLFLPIGVIVSYLPEVIEASKLQLFIVGLSEVFSSECDFITGMCPADWDFFEINDGLGVWFTHLHPDTERLRNSVQKIWYDCDSAIGMTNEAESRSLLSIYGSKARISDFITGVVGRYLREGDAILDLMSGTGIIARKLATCGYRVFANDANLFAALATKALAATPSLAFIRDAIRDIERYFLENYNAVQKLFEEALEIEARFLHGEVNQQSLEEYRSFVGQYTLFLPTDLLGDGAQATTATPTHVAVGDLIEGRHYHPRLFPYCLISGYFSNAYFGLRQSLELDSLRYALDRLNVPTEMADFFLGCLLSTAIACASGPHFAQPPKLHGVRAMREIIEHRARSVYEDFMLRVVLANHGGEGQGQVKWVGNADWRVALEHYLKDTSAEPPHFRRAVYLDPPYTKLQYSRYYHVLNTLISYDYPNCERLGRYPPRERRFSSRFEFQPRSAAREFADLLSRVYKGRATCFVSYSDRGFIPITELIDMMLRFYDRVEIFSREIRHHSQGVQSGKSRTTEFVLVGLCHA